MAGFGIQSREQYIICMGSEGWQNPHLQWLEGTQRNLFLYNLLGMATLFTASLAKVMEKES